MSRIQTAREGGTVSALPTVAAFQIWRGEIESWDRLLGTDERGMVQTGQEVERAVVPRPEVEMVRLQTSQTAGHGTRSQAVTDGRRKSGGSKTETRSCADTAGG
jgi:hypothetical protein